MAQFNGADVKTAALLSALSFCALAPERYWASACRFLVRARSSGSTPEFGLEACLPRELLQRMGGNAGFFLQLSSIRDKEYLQVMRHYLPGGWNPKIDIVGGENLEDALANGHGAVLWVSQFSSFHLVSKRALHSAGHPTWHLSEPEHPFSGTPFGIRYLNPIATKVEDRYLAGRLLLPPEADTPEGLGVGALRAMLRLLRENKVVSITVASTARGLIDVPFFQGWLRLPTAPVNLSLVSGAPILPVLPLEVGPGRYEVHIDSPLTSPEGAPRPVAIREAVTDYAARLQAYVTSHPQQWIGPLLFGS